MRQDSNIPFEPVDSYFDVLENILRFNSELYSHPGLCQRLNRFRSWYYIPEIDQFGPSQFVGYKDMTTDMYLKGKAPSGEVSERALNSLFRPVRRSDPDRMEYEEKLFDMCSLYEQKPNKAHRINIPKEDW